MNKKTLIILALIIIAGITSYFYVYRDHRDIGTETATFTVDASDFASEFSKDYEAVIEKYLNQVVIVNGKVSEVEDMAVSIDNSVYCLFDTKIENISTNSSLTVKGRCIGYDELMEIVKLDQSTLIE